MTCAQRRQHARAGSDVALSYGEVKGTIGGPIATGGLREAEIPDKMDMWEASEPYFDWVAREGVTRIVGYKFQDLNELELGAWEQKGRKGAVTNILHLF